MGGEYMDTKGQRDDYKTYFLSLRMESWIKIAHMTDTVQHKSGNVRELCNSLD